MNTSGHIIAVLVFACTPVHAAPFAHYENRRYGFSLDYPADLSAEQQPENGDGQTFSKRNGCLVRAFGSNNALERTAVSVEQERIKEFDKITRRTRGKGWFSVLGSKEGQRRFVKVYVGNGSINELHIEQPLSGGSCAIAIEPVVSTFHPGRLNEAH